MDVHDSERAPHQSKRDHRYYVRLGSQSLPAPHKMIEDIRNRQKHPRVVLGRATTDSLRCHPDSDNQSHFSLDFSLRFELVNEGTLKSSDTFLLANPKSGHFSTAAYSIDVAKLVSGTRPGIFQWQLIRPLAPQSEIIFRVNFTIGARYEPDPPHGRKWYDVHRNVLFDDVAIECKVFADSAPPRMCLITMADLGLITELNSL